MSKRGREFYDEYIGSSLCNPDLADLPPESHAENLAGGADDAGIPLSEVVEEVGPLAPALASAMTKLKP
jgi:hypothetical protein